MPVLYALVGVLFLFAPGILALCALGCRKVVSFSCAPIITIFAYTVLSIVLPMFGVACSWMSIFFSALTVSLLALLIRFIMNQGYRLCGELSQDVVASDSISWVSLGASVTVAVALFSLFFHYLGGIDTLIQGFDTVYHVNLVRSFLESGNYSSLSASIYPLNEALASIPLDSNAGAFYPALWHVLCAMLVGATGAQVVVAANVTNAVLCGVVYPVGFWGLLKALFPKNDRVLVAGSVCVVAFAAFPWAILLRGEQFPQAAAFALVPSSVLLFISILKDGLNSAQRIKYAGLFSCSLVALVFVQTNAVFTVGLFAAFYVAHVIFTAADSGVKGCLFVIAWTVAVVLIWGATFVSPFMKGVVSFSWAAYASYPQAMVNVLTLSLGQGSSAQWILAILVLIGLFYSIFVQREKQIWLAVLYAFLALIYIVDTSSDGTLKHLLSGFWYTDPARTAAMLALYGVIPASLGLSWIMGGAVSLVHRVLRDDTLSPLAEKFLSLCTAVIFVFCFYYPRPLIIGGEDVTTSFGQLAASLRSLSSPDFISILDSDEQQFVSEAFANVPAGSVVINVPDDGSAFLYGTHGIDVYYHRGSIGDGESTNSQLIRTRLYNYVNDSETRAAIEAVGADYVLILDRPDTEGKRGVFHTYQRDMWTGIEGITDNTPGFSLVLSSGDMALYRITGAD